MKCDPIVQEVHCIREQMWDQCGGTLDKLIEHLRAGEASHRDRIISPDKLKDLEGKKQEPAENRNPA